MTTRSPSSCALSPTSSATPARAALASHPALYRWSLNGGASAWADLLAVPEQSLDLCLLRRCTFAGHPFGDDEFTTLFERRFQRIEAEPAFNTFAS